MSDTGSTAMRLVDGTAAWLLTYAIHGTVLLGAAWLASRARVGEHVRETLWKLALAGALLTATAAQLRSSAPAARLSLPSPSVIATPAILDAGAVPVRAESDGTPSVPAARSAQPAHLPWTSLVVLAWLAGAAVALGRLGSGWLRFTRGLSRVPAASGDPAAMVLRELCDAAGVRRPVRLTCSARLTAPVALPGREICIPQDVARRLDGAQLRAMLAHETAHLLRGDPGWLWAASVTAAAFWFQPLLRVCLRGMRNAAEFQADAWAAGRADAFALARCLADVAAWGSPWRVPAPVAGMAGGGASLVTRVERLLHGPREPRPRRRWTAAGVLALALAAAYVPAVTTGRATAQQPARQTSFAARFGISQALADAIERAAVRERIDPELAFRLVRTESRFDERKLGPGGVGLTQIILPTARRLQPGITREQLLQRDTNLRLGLRYLHGMLARYDGNPVRAVQAYYQGPRQLERDGVRRDTRTYSEQLLGPMAGLGLYHGRPVRR